MTKEEVEKALGDCTTDAGKVKCLYVDGNFAMVEYPCGLLVQVRRHTVLPSPDHPIRYAFVTSIWKPGKEDCARNKDGRLTAGRLEAIIARKRSA